MYDLSSHSVDLAEVEEKFGKLPETSANEFTWWLAAALPLAAEVSRFHL